ncbi:amino acid transporter [Halioglobus maricola]|uniref:Amino acid transporter n=1 Tax=Halioglobus maricola TaxID=2601894 RepID=A0A5P9NL23_9GAMM|nr:LysE/ArgO family amino acid transporter [Halioglobus maricola]QFU76477.1 amino acid transporter [Halioglobus maricola]
MESLASGFLLSISLIMAIGAQNAFVLKQGIKKHHVFWVSLVCAVSDALLIAAGIAGFGAAVEAFPTLETVARYGGAAFLIIYGIKSLMSAFGPDHSLEPEGEEPDSLVKIIAMTLAFTWLNPHVYLDTVVLLGAVATQYEGTARTLFGIGAMSASGVFFFSLGYGARFLAPLFHKPVAWKILDALVAMIMFTIAASLLLG